MKERNEALDIAKGIGIILMVIGHSGCPKYLHDFIYMFHMPLFFVCSGYFYKHITTRNELIRCWKKRFRGLYLPYIKWSLAFLFLHNIFYHLNIYSDEYGYQGTTSSLYNTSDIIERLKCILLYMNGHEDLLGGFWFLKALLLSTLAFSMIDFLLSRWKNLIAKYTTIFLFLLIATIITQYTDIRFWIFGSFFQISYGCLFFFTGYLLHQYGHLLRINGAFPNILMFIIVGIGALLIPSEMILVNTIQVIPYFIIATLGSILTINTASYLSRKDLGKKLSIIGKTTMSILALHFLSFKIVSLIKIYIYDLPSKMLSCFPIIEEHNKYFWPLYTVIGVCIPLIVQRLYEKLVKVKK